MCVRVDGVVAVVTFGVCFYIVEKFQLLMKGYVLTNHHAIA